MTNGRALRLALAATLVAATPALAQVDCGATIAKKQKVTLAGNLGPCDGVDAALVVDSGTLDLGGYTVSCADLDGDGDLPQGIVLFGKKAKVMNGTVVGCSNGVGLAGDGKHVVSGMTVLESADDGIDVVPGADKCKIKDSTAMRNADDGIQLRSDKNKLVGNVASENGDDGYDLWSSAERNKVADARAERNGATGLLVDGSKNTLARITATANRTVGIDLAGTQNRVRGGVAQTNATYDLAGCPGDKVQKLSYETAAPDCQ